MKSRWGPETIGQVNKGLTPSESFLHVPGLLRFPLDETRLSKICLKESFPKLPFTRGTAGTCSNIVLRVLDQSVPVTPVHNETISQYLCFTRFVVFNSAPNI